MNEKSTKTDKSISDESIGDESATKCTSLNRNGMYVRNRPNAMKRNPKEQIIELSKLMCGNPGISTLTNGSTSKKRHEVINGRKLCVKVHRLCTKGTSRAVMTNSSHSECWDH